MNRLLRSVLVLGLSLILIHGLELSNLNLPLNDVLGSSQLYADTLTLSIYEIQGQAASSPYVNDTVRTYGIVTAVASNGFFLEEKPGGPWRGIWVFRGNTNPLPSRGDSVEIYGYVQEYYSLTEINSSAPGWALNILASGLSLPAPESLPTGSVSDEQYEGVLVLVDSAICTNPNLGYGEWELNDSSGPVRVDDKMYSYSPQLNGMYRVTGPLYYSFGNYKIEPRDANDIYFYGVPTNPPPVINWVVQSPSTPTPNTPVTIIANITDDGTVVADSIFISASPFGGAPFVGYYHDSVRTDTFFYHISGYPEGYQVSYFIWAMDDQGADSVSDTFSYTVVSVPDVKINEVFYDATSGQGWEPYSEWIEIYNAGNTPVDLSGWYLTDDPDTSGGNEGSYRFPAGTVLNPGAFLAVVNDSDTFATYFDTSGVQYLEYGAVNIYLGNSGDDIHIFDSLGNEVDVMWYGTGGDLGSGFAAPDVPAGHSLGRYPDGTDTDNPSADFFDMVNLTPGAPNTLVSCGDADGNGVVDASDLFYFADYLFMSGPSPVGPMDVNGDGSVNSLDMAYLSAYLWLGGPSPNCP